MAVVAEEVRQVPMGRESGEIAVILNPTSGRGAAAQLQEQLSKECAARGPGCDIRFYATSPEHSAGMLVREAVARKVQRVLLCGGDGTVSDGLVGLIGSEIPAGLIPMGTGNLLAHNLNLMSSLPDMVETALNGIPRPLDIIRLRADRKQVFHSVVMAGVGYDAKIIAGADPKLKRRWGVLAYVASAIQNLKPTSVRVRIRADNGIQGRYWAASVTMANVGQLQGGVSLMPDAEPDDGLLDIAVVQASALPEWLRVFWSVIRRRVWEEPAVALLKVEKATLDFSRRQAFQYDGETAGEVKRLEVEVLKHAVRVMVPMP